MNEKNLQRTTRLTSVTSALALALCLQPAMAKEAFEASLVLTNNGQQDGDLFLQFSQIEDLFDTVKEENLHREFQDAKGSYTRRSGVDAELMVRGLPTSVSYAEGSTALVFEIETLGIREEFEGATRDASEQKFRDHLETNGNDLLTRMLQEMVKSTPIDPLAGNPKSLMSNMNAEDFGGVLAGAMQFSAQTMASPFGASASIGQYSSNGYDTRVLSVPFEYTYQLESDPRKQVKVSAPLTYLDYSGPKAYTGSLGVSYRHPINDDWSLTPGVRAGAIGSVDMGSAGVLYSASIKSDYNIYHNDLKINIGNLLGVYKSSSIDAGDFEVDYDLSNHITRNGVSLEGATDKKMFGKPTSWQAAVTHSYVMGDEVFVDSYFDLIISFGTRYSDGGDNWDSLRFGLSATVGNNDYKGFGLNFGYVF